MGSGRIGDLGNYGTGTDWILTTRWNREIGKLLLFKNTFLPLRYFALFLFPRHEGI